MVRRTKHWRPGEGGRKSQPMADFPPPGEVDEAQWADTFHPEPHRDGEQYGLCEDDVCFMYETYGRDLEYVTRLAKWNPGRVWTYVTGDAGELMLLSGMHLVNRLGYVVTDIAINPELEYWVRLD